MLCVSRLLRFSSNLITDIKNVLKSMWALFLHGFQLDKWNDVRQNACSSFHHIVNLHEHFSRNRVYLLGAINRWMFFPVELLWSSLTISWFKNQDYFHSVIFSKICSYMEKTGIYPIGSSIKQRKTSNDMIVNCILFFCVKFLQQIVFCFLIKLTVYILFQIT